MLGGDKGAHMNDDNPLYGYALLPAPGILVWQCYDWLRTGSWTPIPLSKAFTYFQWPMPHTSWVGLQSIINWLFDIPASLVVFLVSLLVLVVFAIIGELSSRYQANRRST
jgi:hypothetical protein